ncbi:hypothetical protein [Myroides sp.]|uniref:hypothetical protein n=1 Tax=Myroides sp. TaxID=1874736 RepID=UPI003F3FA97E
MIVWSGKGILALLIPFLIGAVGLIFLEFQYGLIMLQAWLVGANLLTWYLGKKWNAIEVYFDPVDQKYYKTENDHTVFWIPMQYISLFLTGCILILLLQSNLYVGILMIVVSAYVIKYDYFKEKGWVIKKAKQRAMSKSEEQDSVPPPLPHSNDWQSRR